MMRIRVFIVFFVLTAILDYLLGNLIAQPVIFTPIFLILTALTDRSRSVMLKIFLAGLIADLVATTPFGALALVVYALSLLSLSIRTRLNLDPNRPAFLALVWLILTFAYVILITFVSTHDLRLYQADIVLYNWSCSAVLAWLVTKMIKLPQIPRNVW